MLGVKKIFLNKSSSSISREFKKYRIKTFYRYEVLLLVAHDYGNRST